MRGKRTIDLKSPVALELRAKGFIPLPRLWVTQDQLSVIFRMAEGHKEIVKEVRARHRNKQNDPWET